MEKKYFPLFIDISEYKIVVIGGGTIATRRIKTLLNFTKEIMVVSPKLTPELSKLCEQGEIIWINDTYHKEQLWKADMVIAATNEPEVNRQVKKDCLAVSEAARHKIPVSVIDDKQQCDFYFPSIVEKGEVVIGINSGGANPGLTKSLRKKIEEVLACDSLYKE